MADPLSLLRKYNVNKKEIIERESQIIFGEVSCPKNARTNYVITDKSVIRDWASITYSTKAEVETDPCSRYKRGVKEYYTLECLLFFLKNSLLKHPVYCKRAEAAHLPAVRRPDRKKLLAYLNGETVTCASIDKNAPLEIPTQLKRTHDSNIGQLAAKKQRIEDTCFSRDIDFD